MVHLPAMSPQAIKRLSELARNPYRPEEIVELKERIDGEIRAAELNFSVTGVIDENRVQEIVLLKRQLDALYGAWVEGELS